VWSSPLQAFALALLLVAPPAAANGHAPRSAARPLVMGHVFLRLTTGK
jgi:hypothetical protein